MLVMTPTLPHSTLRAEFGERIQFNAPLARFTAARIGGPAEALLVVESARELARAVTYAWEETLPFVVLGAGSNVLVSDLGVRGIVILNKARAVEFKTESDPPQVWAESGANFGALARAAAGRGLAGLEWAAGIPGTVGGAVFGNAGAHGGDMAGNLVWADVLVRGHREQRWNLERMAYGYRTSALKRSPGSGIVLSAQMNLAWAPKEEIEGRTEAFLAYRKLTQPPGASMGSMFKNPPGDYSGRLIDAAGLKGTRVGEAEISSLHANFFINRGGASADDVRALIMQAHDVVLEEFGVDLELEVELIGEWTPHLGGGHPPGRTK